MGLFFIVQSATVTPSTSLLISPSVTNTPLYYFSFSGTSIPQSFSTTPSTSITPSPSSSILPSLTPKPTPSPIYERIGDPIELIAKFSCTATQKTCCNDFVNIWASFVRVNNANLIDLKTCTLDSSLEGITQDIPLSVTYNQYSSTIHSNTEIISDYWIAGECVTLDPFTDGPCYPDGDALDSFEWSRVFSIQIQNSYYTPVDFSSSRTASPFISPTSSPEPTANTSSHFNYSVVSLLALFLLFTL